MKMIELKTTRRDPWTLQSQGVTAGGGSTTGAGLGGGAAFGFSAMAT